MSKKTYLVERPFHGVQTYYVEANSAAEAKRKVNDGDPDVEPCGFDVTRTFNASYAQAEKP
jgi:hypothetical protein